MEHIVHVERGDQDESRDLEMATAISQVLCKAYPNHYWLVSFTGHALVIRHVLIASLVTLETGKEGFGSLLPKDRMGTIHEVENEALRHAAAMLEAFGLPRAAWNGCDVPVMPQDLKREILARRQLRGWGPGR